MQQPDSKEMWSKLINTFTSDERVSFLHLALQLA